MTPKRMLSFALAAALLAAIPLSPASAARRVRVVSCPGGDCWPTAFDFTPNGRELFYVRRFTGEIRVKNLRTGRDRRWARIRGVATSGEQGLLGLALDPRWKRQRFVYAYYTNRSPFQNRVVRLRKRGGETKRKRLLTLGANGNHNGGVIHFGPDGKLYVVTGDLGNPGNAQVRSHPAGKVLRITRSGARPKGNPFSRSKAWSYGHRNSFGFAFDPRTGRLWQTENGPTCTDEINRIVRGGNYGWGSGSSCPDTSTEGPDPIKPQQVFNPVQAPTGATFCHRCRLGRTTNGKLLVGTWNTGRIYRYGLRGERRRLGGRSLLFENPRGVLALERAPNGRVYLSDPSGIYRLRR